MTPPRPDEKTAEFMDTVRQSTTPAADIAAAVQRGELTGEQAEIVRRDETITLKLWLERMT